MKAINEEITAEAVIIIPLKSVFCFTRGDDVLGYIEEEETLQDGKSFTTFTPFTSEKLLTETRCRECAVVELIKHRAGNADFLPCDRRPHGFILEIIATQSYASPLH